MSTENIFTNAAKRIHSKTSIFTCCAITGGPEGWYAERMEKRRFYEDMFGISLNDVFDEWYGRIEAKRLRRKYTGNHTAAQEVELREIRVLCLLLAQAAYDAKATF